MASTAGTYKMPVTDTVGTLTLDVRITGVRVWRMRLWLAVQIIRLAGYVAGFGGTNVSYAAQEVDDGS